MLLRHKSGCVSTLTTWFLKEYFAGIQVGRTRPLPQILGICRLNVEEGSVQNSAFAATGSLVMRPRRLLGMTSCAIPSLFLLILCLSFAAKPSRSQCGSLGGPSTTWSDGNNGSWTTAGNWTGGVPNASTNACIIDGTNTVILSGSGDVGSLQLASGNGLVVGNSSRLAVAGSSILNAGSILVDSTGSFTDLVLNPGGTLTLSGGGTLTFSNSLNNRVYSTDGGTDTVINDVSHTIQRSGQFGINNAGFRFALTNNGIIDANHSDSLQPAPSEL